jgi:hypothetical protein
MSTTTCYVVLSAAVNFMQLGWECVVKSSVNLYAMADMVLPMHRLRLYRCVQESTTLRLGCDSSLPGVVDENYCA